MIKKIAMLALTASAVFSNVFAADECSIAITPNTSVFTGNQIKPTVTRVMCDEIDVTNFTVSYGKNINAGNDAGSVYVTITGNPDPIEKKFKIAKKGIKLKINDAQKEKGTKDPAFTWSMGEVENVNLDTLNRLQESLEDFIQLTRTAGEDVSTYPITIADGIDDELITNYPNYNISTDPGEFTITKTNVTVVAKSGSKVYGEKDPKNFEYTINGNIDESEYAQLGKITLSREAGENVTKEGYTINVSVENMETDDFIVKTVSGVWGITPAPVKVTVADVEKVYGDATPEITYEIKGLVGEDELTTPTISCKKCLASGLESVGEYAVGLIFDETKNKNYKITVETGLLTVTPRAATVTMDDAEKIYGDADPKFTYTTKGLVEGESLSDVEISRAEGENVGTYKVSVSLAEGANSNYTLTVVPGTLTISPKEVTLAVTNIKKKFGETDPELKYTVDGIASFGGVEDVLEGVSLTREKGEDAGEYAITATVDAKKNPNYVITTTDGKLTITANDDEIVVTIVGHSDVIEYDGKEHVLKGFDISSNSEAFDLKFVKYTGDSLVAGTDAGKYNMGLSEENFENTSVNYPNVTFEITDGLLEISPKSVVVTAKADTITYGDAIPEEFEWVAEGLLKGDELDNIHVSLDKTGLLDAGEYPLTFDKMSPTNKNYVVSKYEAAFLTVNQKLVTVTIADAEKIYGDADPEKFSYEVDGLLDGDQLPELILAREKGENVLRDSDGQDSSYRISGTFVSDPNENYKVKVRQGKFTVKPYPIKITVAVFGEDVVEKYTGEEITVDKKFDVALIPSLDYSLPAGYSYSKDFVTYTGEKTVTGKEMGSYAMGLAVSDFVNISPNFDHVSFVISIDGNLVINETGPEISLATVKGVKTFGLSSMNRRIQVSGSVVGDRYAVHDMRGRVVRSGVVESANFEIPVTNAGVYMVRVGSSAKRIRVK